ncbi:hypothetical protein F4825DRAFT_376696 [Nemania diffusa]|nr:hypothetical protein F4825DRAFT_376696 [Nemania diffusa]
MRAPQPRLSPKRAKNGALKNAQKAPIINRERNERRARLVAIVVMMLCAYRVFLAVFSATGPRKTMEDMMNLNSASLFSHLFKTAPMLNTIFHSPLQSKPRRLHSKGFGLGAMHYTLRSTYMTPCHCSDPVHTYAYVRIHPNVLVVYLEW